MDALLEAVRQGDCARVERELAGLALTAAGAAASSTSVLSEAAADAGAAVLAAAVRVGSAPVLALLLRAGADPFASAGAGTPSAFHACWQRGSSSKKAAACLAVLVEHVAQQLEAARVRSAAYERKLSMVMADYAASRAAVAEAARESAVQRGAVSKQEAAAAAGTDTAAGAGAAAAVPSGGKRFVARRIDHEGASSGDVIEDDGDDDDGEIDDNDVGGLRDAAQMQPAMELPEDDDPTPAVRPRGKRPSAGAAAGHGGTRNVRDAASAAAAAVPTEFTDSVPQPRSALDNEVSRAFQRGKLDAPVEQVSGSAGAGPPTAAAAPAGAAGRVGGGRPSLARATSGRARAASGAAPRAAAAGAVSSEAHARAAEEPRAPSLAQQLPANVVSLIAQLTASDADLASVSHVCRAWRSACCAYAVVSAAGDVLPRSVFEQRRVAKEDRVRAAWLHASRGADSEAFVSLPHVCSAAVSACSISAHLPRVLLCDSTGWATCVDMVPRRQSAAILTFTSGASVGAGASASASAGAGAGSGNHGTVGAALAPQLRARIRAHASEIGACMLVDAATSAGGGYVVTGGSDGDVRVFALAADGGRASFVRECAGHARGITALAMAGSDALVSASLDKVVRLWDWARDGRSLGTLRGHPAEIGAVHFSHAMGAIVSGDRSGCVRLWDARMKRVAHSAVARPVGSITCLASVGQTVMCGDDRGRVLSWDVRRSGGVSVGASGTGGFGISGAGSGAGALVQRAGTPVFSTQVLAIGVWTPQLTVVATQDGQVSASCAPLPVMQRYASLHRAQSSASASPLDTAHVRAMRTAGASGVSGPSALPRASRTSLTQLPSSPVPRAAHASVDTSDEAVAVLVDAPSLALELSASDAVRAASTPPPVAATNGVAPSTPTGSALGLSPERATVPNGTAASPAAAAAAGAAHLMRRLSFRAASAVRCAGVGVRSGAAVFGLQDGSVRVLMSTADAGDWRAFE